MVILSINHVSTHNTCFIMPIPFPPTERFITIKIDNLRLRRSKSDQFYIILQHQENCKRPTLLIVGSTGNIYTITIHPSVITCSCLDFGKRQKPCKHILFMLHRLNFLPLNDDFFSTPIFLFNYCPFFLQKLLTMLPQVRTRPSHKSIVPFL